ncbi:MAG: ABC-F family ATP-binding cassette domain-containing protein [Parachlamydiaceae bacterium]|nr:ABC-F family ATP-binding cassette domain-containing protein [Parachlamydiaceae bacterium]
MSSLIGVHKLSKAHGTQILFKELSFTISEGDRIGLLGPNGSGKSTLVKILAGVETPDDGFVSRRQGLRLGYASQVPEFPDLSVEEVVMQNAMANEDEVEKLTRARILLGKAQFEDTTVQASVLSGGWKKRLDIVRALMQEPDLLLLDEPTNHLDLEGILWLEKFLYREKIAYLVVSHDRYFLENISNKVIELNRCFPQGLFISEGNMSAFMEHKEAFLDAQAQQERGLASQVRYETEWLKRSPKARTTKSRSRIQKAYELIEELSEIKQRNKSNVAEIDFSASDRATRRLLVAKNLGKKLGDKQLFNGIELVLSPGTRLGIVGKNGTGKTSLLKVLAGQLPQDTGTIKYADELKLVYFDQHREHIPPEITLKRALAPNSDTVSYRGQPMHVNGWAKKFLFSPDRLELPVWCLSGGERARILIAKLMLEPADILFLDEPTNDLDIPTLEIIEESLKEFAGALVLISHDRCLMDRVCTQILGLGRSNEHELFADYSQWETSNANASKASAKPAVVASPGNKPVSAPKKLSYKEQKELDEMEASIVSAETEIEELQEKLNDPTKHSDAQQALQLYQDLAKAQLKLETLYERWGYLGSKSK